MRPGPLRIFWDQRLVGILTLNPEREFHFCYDEQWLAASDSQAISLNLPLCEQPFSGARVRSFFANLLPEGDLRHQICQRLGLSPQSVFGLLQPLAGDCAGALSVAAGPGPPRNQGYVQIPMAQLEKLANSRSVLPQLTGAGGVRLCLAGSRDKLPVFLDGNRFYLPLEGSPSSHILKFEGGDLPYLTANEVFCNMLARTLNLPVPEMALVKVGCQSLVVIKRHDRYLDTQQRLRRLHQEDFCQALGWGPAQKYQTRGFVSLEGCFELLDRHSLEPAPDLESLLRWQIFNLLCGNSDGHAKNLSLLYGLTGTVRLAPFYDLVCTRAYRLLKRDLALAVGRQGDPDQVCAADWRSLARRVGVGKKYLQKQVDQMARQVEPAALETAQEFRHRYGESPILQMIMAVLRRQSHRIRKMA